MRLSWTSDDDRAFYRHAFFTLNGWVECITAARREEPSPGSLPRRPAPRAADTPSPDEGEDEKPHRAPVRAKRWHRVVFWSVVLVIAYAGVRVILT